MNCVVFSRPGMGPHHPVTALTWLVGVRPKPPPILIFPAWQTFSLSLGRRACGEPTVKEIWGPDLSPTSQSTWVR